MSVLRPLLVAVTSIGVLPAQDAAKHLAIERELVLRSGQSHSLAWSRDGKWIASGGSSGEVLVVDSATGAVVHELPASDHWVGELRFSPDDAQLAVSARDLSVWDLATGEASRRCPTGGASAMDWNHAGTRLAVVDTNQCVSLLHAESLERVRALDVPDDTAIDAIAFSPDDTEIAIGKRSCATFVFAIANGKQIERLEQQGWVQSLAWLDDGRLLRLSQEGALHGLTERPAPLPQFTWGMAADPRGRLCLAWKGDAVHGFLPRVREPFVVAGGGPCAIHPDGASWVRARGGFLECFAGTSLRKRLPLPHRAAPSAASITADSRYVALCDRAGTLSVFHANDGARIALPDGIRGVPVPHCATPDLALWIEPPQGEGPYATGRLQMWSVAAAIEAKAPLREVALLTDVYSGAGSSLRIARDGRTAATAHRVFDLGGSEPVAWGIPDGVEDELLPAPSGQVVLIRETRPHVPRLPWFGSCNLEVMRRDGTRTATRRHEGRVFAVEWSPDGTRIGLLSWRGLHLLAPDTLQELRLVRGAWWDFAWLDDERLLLRDAGPSSWTTEPREPPGLALLHIDRVESIAHLTLPEYARLLCVDAHGALAVLGLHDRALVVRIDR